MKLIVCEGYIPKNLFRRGALERIKGMYPESNTLPEQHTSPFRARLLIKPISIIFIGLLFLPMFNIHGETIPEWFLPFSDAVYEQVQSRTQITLMYTEAKKKAVESYSGYHLYILLSRCEYVMGLFFRYEGQNGEAAAFYERGIEWAEKSLAEYPSSEAYQVLATNIALACQVKPLLYQVANVNNIGKYAKNALELDPRNVIAGYLLAVPYIYSPAPFCNPGKGLQMLEELIRDNTSILPQLSKECRYNLYSAMAMAHHKLKRQEEARLYLAKALEVYPTNKYVKKSLSGI